MGPPTWPTGLAVGLEGLESSTIRLRTRVGEMDSPRGATSRHVDPATPRRAS